jgi:hypothetical protein
MSGESIVSIPSGAGKGGGGHVAQDEPDPWADVIQGTADVTEISNAGPGAGVEEIEWEAGS